MGRRGWAIVTGLAALAAAVAGVIGNHLPWPAVLERHPLWTTATFLTLAGVVAIVSAVLFAKDGSASDPLASSWNARASAPDATAVVSGDHSVIAGSDGIAVGPGGSVVLFPKEVQAEPLPVPGVDVCFGRDAEVARVAAGWAAGRVPVVLGGPGIGKSTVFAHALTDAAVVAAYGPRRYVVSCEGAESAQAVVDKLADKLGVPLGDHLRNRVISYLYATPCVLVLDNFETPTDGDPQGAAELVATLRSEGGKVALGLGYRGAALPFSIGNADEVRLDPLPDDDARNVFVAAAGGKHRADPALDSLMQGLDGVPLALVLLGALARTEPDLDTLSAAWRAKRTDLLQRGAKPDRTSSLPLSIELSWERLDDDGRAALSLASMLPDGWPKGRHTMYLPDSLAAGIVELRSRALLHEDATRQRCLAPIRQHVLAHHPAAPDLLDQFLPLVASLAVSGKQVGSAEGAAVVSLLAPEFTNLVDVLRSCLPTRPNLAAVVPRLLEFQRFTGLGDDQLGLEAVAASFSPSVEAHNCFVLGLLYSTHSEHSSARGMFAQALPLYRRTADVVGEANCLSALGQVEFSTSNKARARELFDQALPLYREKAATLGVANCLIALGEVDLSESNNERARELYDEALQLYRQIDHALGAANSLAGLGRIDFRESNNERARALFGEALPLYRQVGAVVGEANCLSSLGQVEFVESENDRARSLYGAALPLYRQVGAVVGEANCLRNISEIEDLESNRERAFELLGQALPLYRRIGDATGEANCLRRLGDLEFRRSNNTRARELLSEAQTLFRRIGSVLGEANCLNCLGQIEFDEANIAQAREVLDKAITLYRKAGVVLGEANCLRTLGRIALNDGEPDQARELFGKALPLYRRVGDVLGEANVLRSLGEVELRESSEIRARELFSEALPLYERIRDRYSQAITHAWLARTTSGDQRAEHYTRLAALAQDADRPGFLEGLREIADG